MLGGSSSINAMLYIRGQKEDYDHWAALGNDGWSFSDVLPYFKSTQHQERGADNFHGVGGQLNVADSISKPAITIVLSHLLNRLVFHLMTILMAKIKKGLVIIK